jgi:hypothetical protein
MFIYLCKEDVPKVIIIYFTFLSFITYDKCYLSIKVLKYLQSNPRSKIVKMKIERWKGKGGKKPLDMWGNPFYTYLRSIKIR